MPIDHSPSATKLLWWLKKLGGETIQGIGSFNF